ncbi:MAG: hypothetical protein LV479_06260 [Methylacidiphilales bacterium]|nr:hypothetical protein [Candidatus Methylacidiphilales bacterium]
MKTFTLEFTPEIAREMLPTLERQHRQLVNLAAVVEKQIEAIRKELRPKTEDAEEVFAQSNLARVSHTQTGRAKKGETEKVVSDFLRQVNGAGTTMSTITKRTGTKYGSVRRILKNFLQKGAVTTKDNLWFWN